MEKTSPEKLQAIANQLRIDSIRATQAASSGHPTSCLSAADIVSVLFFDVMRYDPKNPKNPNNDRFILSKGHAAPLLYAAWAEAGIIERKELLKLRTFESDLEGHPTPRLPWVDIATGSLGQGLSVGVGMALAARLNKLDYRTFVLMGDGEIAEGSVWEAASMASHYKLTNLIGIVDVNRLGQSQPTMFEHDLEIYKARFEAFGWNAFIVDGHEINQIRAALSWDKVMMDGSDMQQILSSFEKSKDKPTVLIAKTFKGFGVSFLSNKDSWHGKALKKEEMDLAIAELKTKAESAKDIKIQPPAEKKTAENISTSFPELTYKLGELIATREAYGATLVRLGGQEERITVVDGDTKNSTFAEKFTKAYPERFFECFIAEQNMVGVAVGLATRGKIPFVSTFAAFLTRAYDQIRMAGVSGAHVILVGSHAGVSIGEDGVSQMALEDIAMMRSVYGSTVLYPCDAVSTERLIEEVLPGKGMVYLRASRPKTPVIYENNEKFPIGGLKILRQSDQDKATVVAAGITVFESLKAYEELQKEGIHISVIDLYSIKPLDAKSLVEAAKRTENTLITVEDHYIQGGIGDAVAGEVSSEGIKVHKLAIQELPHSGKPEELIDKYGIGSRSIIEKVKKLLKKNKT